MTARAYFARKALHPMVGLCQNVANVGPVALALAGGGSWFCRICASLPVFACSQRAQPWSMVSEWPPAFEFVKVGVGRSLRIQTEHFFGYFQRHSVILGA